ncbi:hypothetical protein MRB53_042277 [Persea americana]|nr:hypothetical protein MRB53_042277 [Persea americana]
MREAVRSWRRSKRRRYTRCSLEALMATCRSGDMQPGMSVATGSIRARVRFVVGCSVTAGDGSRWRVDPAARWVWERSRARPLSIGSCLYNIEGSAVPRQQATMSPEGAWDEATSERRLSTARYHTLTSSCGQRSVKIRQATSSGGRRIPGDAVMSSNVVARAGDPVVIR